jgi:hypothetical protein
MSTHCFESTRVLKTHRTALRIWKTTRSLEIMKSLEDYKARKSARVKEDRHVSRSQNLKSLTGWQTTRVKKHKNNLLQCCPLPSNKRRRTRERKERH